MTARRVGVIFKYPIPVDDARHPVPWGMVLGTRVTGVEVRADDPRIVDMWVLHPAGIEEGERTRQFSVIATGQPFDTKRAEVVGTTRHPASQLVWHVIGHLS